MKILAVIGLFICLTPTYSQEKANDSLIWVRKTCETGLADAKEDFKKGKYNSYSYGLLFIMEPKKSEVGFEDFYEKYMLEKYAINIEHRGCVISEHSSCYSEEMDRLISQKFGKDIFKIGRKEAKKLFKRKK